MTASRKFDRELAPSAKTGRWWSRNRRPEAAAGVFRELFLSQARERGLARQLDEIGVVAMNFLLKAASNRY